MCLNQAIFSLVCYASNVWIFLPCKFFWIAKFCLHALQNTAGPLHKAYIGVISFYFWQFLQHPSFLLNVHSYIVCLFFLSVTPATTVPGQADSASIKSPALPTQQAVTPVQAGTTTLATTVAPTSASPQSQLPHQTQAHMPTQSPTSLQVKTQGGTAQLKLQQSPQIISMSGLQQQVQVWHWTTCYCTQNGQSD